MVDPAEIAVLTAEAHRWAARRSADPYDRAAREALAQILLQMQGDRFPLGSVERGRHLLSVMGDAFPIAAAQDAYFTNLGQLLARRDRRSTSGQIVLGLGSGRCGSTSLTAMLAAIEGSCCTHENPPLLYWTPLAEQLDFHMKRFAALAKIFPLVFDASHWWLNALDVFFAHFPDGKVIGLHREVEACARSFLHRKGPGRGSINHWVPPANGIWRTNIWDPVYPTYPLPPNAEADPDGAKLDVIRRYVTEYNATLRHLAGRFPEKIILLRTEELDDPAAQRRVFDFVGVAGRPSEGRPAPALNVGTAADGKDAFTF